jgi:hypothetical protein
MGFNIGNLDVTSKPKSFYYAKGHARNQILQAFGHLIAD